MTTIELKEVDSTNEYLKRRADLKEAVVFAERQTSGKGTKGRSFSSQKGGLYVSVLRTYENFQVSNAFKIMVNCCVAVCKTLQTFGLSPQIRWANDVLVEGKKISGTLIENVISGNTLRSVVGIGINVCNNLPKNLQNIATRVCDHAAFPVSVEDVKAEFLKRIAGEYSIEDYKAYIGFFGKKITLITGEDKRRATALNVAEDGRLAVMAEDGGIEYISSAEVSLII